MPHQDPVQLLQELIKCPSVTPQEGGALVYLEQILTALGFSVERIVFSQEGEADVDNLYARYGSSGQHLMFAGHTDVVPPGDRKSWTHDPFSGAIENDLIYGRGAVDMKGGIACFIAAFARFLDKNSAFDGSVSLLITGDEEGPAVNGTEKLLHHMANKGERWDACIVGEPTNPETLGDMIKIGRRGSMSARVTISGTQGHVAYPDRTDNPVRGATSLMAALMNPQLDDGTDQFPPTNLEVTSVDVGNRALNVIPAQAQFQFNIRFNDLWNEHSLKAEIEKRLKTAAQSDTLRPGKEAIAYQIEYLNRVSPVFLTQDKSLIKTLSKAIERTQDCIAELSTTGGTSDARFIKDFCPVVEFGLVGQTMHMIDEHANIQDLYGLTDIYETFLNLWFKQ